MSKAIYHPEKGRQVEFDVLSKNRNGTVNLGLAANPEKPEEPLLVVGSCKVTDAAEIGACVLIQGDESGESLASLTKPQLVDKAELLGIDTKGMNKADIVSAIETKEAEESAE